MSHFLGQVNGTDMILALALLLLYIRPQPHTEPTDGLDTKQGD